MLVFKLFVFIVLYLSLVFYQCGSHGVKNDKQQVDKENSKLDMELADIDQVQEESQPVEEELDVLNSKAGNMAPSKEKASKKEVSSELTVERRDRKKNKLKKGNRIKKKQEIDSELLKGIELFEKGALVINYYLQQKFGEKILHALLWINKPQSLKFAGYPNKEASDEGNRIVKKALGCLTIKVKAYNAQGSVLNKDKLLDQPSGGFILPIRDQETNFHGINQVQKLWNPLSCLWDQCRQSYPPYGFLIEKWNLPSELRKNDPKKIKTTTYIKIITTFNLGNGTKKRQEDDFEIVRLWSLKGWSLGNEYLKRRK